MSELEIVTELPEGFPFGMKIGRIQRTKSPTPNTL